MVKPNLALKSSKKESKPQIAKKIDSSTPNKYEKLTSKKRKLEEPTSSQPKKIRLGNDLSVKKNGNLKPKKIFEKKITKPSDYLKGKLGAKKFSKEKNFQSKTFAKSENGAKLTNEKVVVKKKDLKKQRRQKKLAENYDASINTKKIWETLRRADTTEDTRKKLCSTLFDHVKSRILQFSFAHDTCRVIECLVQYGNEKHRTGVYEELKDNLVELSKSKYARFMIKKLLTYCTKDQKDLIIKSFIGRVTKLIKHSFACQVIETIYNEHANYSQRNQMQMEFYDTTFALFNDQKYKSLKDIIEAQPFSKEKILSNLKEILVSCVTKTLLMFSLIHRVFLEYFQNCEQKDKLEMIDLLSEHLVHMLHTKDGTQVALQCVWFGSAKERKKIVKSLKSFILKIALEEYGHMLLIGIFDSVDDTKFVSKSVLEELFRSTKELFDNEYGRKVITYLIAPRDTRFFIKDYVKRFEAGETSETRKKDPQLREKELFNYSKPFLKEFLNKETANLMFNGAGGILLPILIEKFGQESSFIIEKIADCLLQTRFEVSCDEKANTNKETNEPEKKSVGHIIEEATSHFILKQILTKDIELSKNSFPTLTNALLSHSNSIMIRSWISCNRGCFAIVKLIEASDDLNKKKIKILLENCETQLAKNEKNAGAKILLKKLEEIH